MQYHEERKGLHFEIDEGNYRISPGESEKMQADLGTLKKAVANFPVAGLKVRIAVLNPGKIRAELSLHLPGARYTRRTIIGSFTQPGSVAFTVCSTR